MTENMKKFAEFVSANEDAKKELHEAVSGISKDAKQALFEATAKFAEKYGLKLTEDDFKAETEEISQDELEAVAAGINVDCPSNQESDPMLVASCYVVLGGACW